MIRISICLLVFAMSLLTASAAFAECQEPESGWSIRSDETYSLPAEGSVVFSGTYSGNAMGLEDTEGGFTVRRRADDSEVAGTADFLDYAGGYRASWTPSEPLEVGEALYATFAGRDFNEIDMVVVEEVVAPTVTIRNLTVMEGQFASRRRCCETQDWCDNPCAATCERCVIEAYDYPQLAGFDGTIAPAVRNDLYAIEYGLLQSDGETPFESSGTGVEFSSTEEFSTWLRGLPDGTTGFCVRHDVRNVVTGEIASSDITCSEGLTLQTVERSETFSLDPSECSTDFATVYDENGSEQVPFDDEEEPLDPGFGEGSPAEKESGGCSSGAGTPNAILVFLGLFAFGLRRRRPS